MIINGREIGFKYTILSTKELEKLCPGNDISKLSEQLQSKDTLKQFETAEKVIAALNAGYEKAKKFNDPDYIPKPLTIDELDSLSSEEFGNLLEEALLSMKEKQTVEAEPIKNVVGP